VHCMCLSMWLDRYRDDAYSTTTGLLLVTVSCRQAIVCVCSLSRGKLAELHAAVFCVRYYSPAAE
jgi:hypothetical protein